MFKPRHSFGNVRQKYDLGKGFLRGFGQDAFQGYDRVRSTLNPLLDRAEEAVDSKYVQKVRNLLAAGEDLSPHLQKFGLTDKYDQGVNYAQRGVGYARQGSNIVDQAMSDPRVKYVRKMVGAGGAHIPRGIHGASYPYQVMPRYR